AHTSFGNVRPGVERGYFYGDKKEVGNSLTFALVQTLGREEYLNEEYFKADYFDYIVIDEFHHAAAGSYQRILDYFKPKFLLGLTATPERMDNKSVFKLCDYNLVYEIRLFDAINRGELVPFRYYGVHDTTVDYDNVTYLNGKYKSDELEKALMINKRGELVLKHYLNYKSNYALGFCETRKHAEFMAKYFSESGVSAICVHSGETGEYVEDRKEAIKLLNKGEVKVIFSVDMFNEGVDIPKVDLVMMLRPTQSPTVFLQQLGRGLRKYKDKEYLNVLDFIGNYRKANKIPLLLAGSSEKAIGKLPSEITYPEECYVNFDMTLIDIFKEQNKAGISIKSIVKEEYLRIKELLGETPTRVDLLTYMEEIIYEKGRTTKEFPLKNYLKYLSEEDILTEEEERILNSRAYDFINMIETTSMSKAYKMPILLAFYNKGNFKMKITDEDVYNSFKEFYSCPSNARDMLQHTSTKDFKSWDMRKYVKLAKDNPIKNLAKTHSDFFEIENNVFSIAKEVEEFIYNETFLKHVKDAIEYRKLQYYKDRFDKESEEE
ncbi:MAG: DEAD/DEAH box helicase, partial [Clostridium sp.]